MAEKPNYLIIAIGLILWLALFAIVVIGVSAVSTPLGGGAVGALIIAFSISEVKK